jgi:tight adherence protein C
MGFEFSAISDALLDNLTAFVALFVFLFVAAITFTVVTAIRSREGIRRRVLLSGSIENIDPDDRRGLRHQQMARTRRLLTQAASNFVPQDEKSISAVRKQLTQAGFYQPSAVANYYLVRVVLAVLLPGAFFFANQSFDLEFTGTRELVALASLAVLGLFLPRIILARITSVLQRQSREGFPDFMDLMVVCAEAGLSVDAALERVSRELTTSYPFLGSNLHMATLELRAGKGLSDAFQYLAERLGIQEALNLGSLLQQSQELGTSLSDALRVFSDEMRDKRMAAAEEKAHALPAKMAVPMMIFVFPIILVVILLPVFVRVSTNL